MARHVAASRSGLLSENGDWSRFAGRMRLDRLEGFNIGRTRSYQGKVAKFDDSSCTLHHKLERVGGVDWSAGLKRP